MHGPGLNTGRSRFSSSWPAFRSKHPTIQWVTVLFPWGKSDPDVKMTTPPSSTGVTNASFYKYTVLHGLRHELRQLFTRACVLLAFVHSFIYLFIHKSIHPFIHSCMSTCMRAFCVYRQYFFFFFSWNFGSLFKHWYAGHISVWHVTLHYAHTHTHTHTQTHTHTLTHTLTQTHTHLHRHSHSHTQAPTHTHTHTHSHRHTHTHTRTNTYTHSHSHTHTHTETHTHTHTHTRTDNKVISKTFSAFLVRKLVLNYFNQLTYFHETWYEYFVIQGHFDA
jgi:hypothetical protein